MIDSKEVMERKLLDGWEWMKREPDGPRKDTFFTEKYVPLLAIYEATHGADQDSYGRSLEDVAVEKLIQKEAPLPEPSPWIEELREELVAKGADVEERQSGPE